MTDTSSADTLPRYPMARECPFSPPPPLAQMRANGGLQRVRIWNGMEPWLVTRYDLARQLLSAEPQITIDSDTPGFPPVNPGYLARRRVTKSFISMDNPGGASRAAKGAGRDP